MSAGGMERLPAVSEDVSLATSGDRSRVGVNRLEVAPVDRVEMAVQAERPLAGDESCSG